MTSQNNEMKKYLIEHGFSRADVRSMTEKELLQAISVLLDSDEVSQNNNSESSQNTSQEMTRKHTDPPKKSYLFNDEIENGGLSEEEALRLALRESMNCQSNNQDTSQEHESVSIPSQQDGQSSHGIIGFLSNAMKIARDAISKNKSLNQQNLFNTNDFLFSSDDEDIIQTDRNRHDYHPQQRPNYHHYPPPPPPKQSHFGNNDDDIIYLPQDSDDDFSHLINHDNEYFQSKAKNDDNHLQNNFDGDNQQGRIDSSSDSSNYSSSEDAPPEIFNQTSKIIQQQNEDLKRMEEEVAQKEREEEEKKLLQDEEHNIEEACQNSLADEIIYYLDEIKPEPPEPKTQAEKKNVATIAVNMNNSKRIVRRFSVDEKGIYVYAWVAGHTLDSDEMLTLESFELKMPQGDGKVLNKNFTLGEQDVRGKVLFMISEIEN